MRGTLFALSLFGIAQPSHASLLPSAWSLSVGVDTFAPGGGDGESIGFLTPQASFHNHHSITFVGSTVSAQYDFEITEAMAEYNIQTQMSCGSVDNDGPLCQAGGRLVLTATTDIQIEAVSTYNFAMTTDPMSVFSNFLVVQTAPLQLLFGANDSDTTNISGPHSGTLSFTASGLVPAGTPFRVDYLFRTRFLTSAPNAVSPSSGNIHITMTAVPEPCSLRLLALGAIAVMKRFRRA